MAPEPRAPKKAAPTKKAASVKKTAAKKAAPAKAAAPKKAATKKAAPKKAAPKKVAGAKKAPVKKTATRTVVAPSVAPPPFQPPAPLPPLTIATPPTAPPVVRAPDLPTEAVRDDHVVVTFAGPQPQRRWTVALRVILMVPHILWLYLLNIATFFVLLISWIAALFTGRVPDGLSDFLARYTGYTTRLAGYGLLLTDEYPPFSFQNEDYAIGLEVSPGRLNRAAVLFRIILLIPAVIVASVLFIGVYVVSIVAWIATLILGRLPTPLFEGNAAALSYYARVNAYYTMLTAEYPSRLFGDKPSPAAATWDPADDEVPALPSAPRISRLVLSRPGRRVVGLYLALGVVFGVAGLVVAITSTIATQSALRDLHDDHAALIVDLGQFNASAQRCAISGGIDCLHQADFRLAQGFDRFADEVTNISFPANLDASNLVRDARDASDALKAMGKSGDLQSYSSAANRFAQVAQRFDADYRTLDLGAAY